MRKANVDHIISGQEAAVSTLDHSTTTPRADHILLTREAMLPPVYNPLQNAPALLSCDLALQRSVHQPVSFEKISWTDIQCAFTNKIYNGCLHL